MIRFLISVASSLVMSAIAMLLSGWWLAEWVTVQLGGFIVAVLVFTVAQAILAPFVFNLARKHASALLGGIGLVSTFLALWVATLFEGGITVSGLGWLLAPLLIWIVTAFGGWIIMGVILKRYFEDREREKIARKVK